jgi:mRNA interferase MazF
MLICDVGDTVVVPFPFTDRPVVKRRPALALSRRAFNTDNGHTVLAMITTAAGSAWPSDIPITDGTSAGLDHSSTIRWKLFTLPNSLLVRLLGHLGDEDRARVDVRLADIFGLQA